MLEPGGEGLLVHSSIPDGVTYFGAFLNAGEKRLPKYDKTTDVGGEKMNAIQYYRGMRIASRDPMKAAQAAVAKGMQAAKIDDFAEAIQFQAYIGAKQLGFNYPDDDLGNNAAAAKRLGRRLNHK
jgi:hypothetical protein